MLDYPLPSGSGAERTSTWVSKTDLTRFLRCPYAFYLLDRGLIAFEDAVNEHQVRLIQDGFDFQAKVEAKALPREIEPADLPRLFAEESIRLFGVPIFENPGLEIYGQPDAIDTAEGALIPVEVKSHKDVQRSDELELAFYWMLLEPLRTRNVSPCGFLLLRRNGVDEQVQVALGPHRFEQVRTLLQQVRDARTHGVPPRMCRCTVCSGVMREEIERATLAKKDLTRLWGIGPAYARQLEAIGINDYEAILAIDSAAVVERLRNNDYKNISSAHVDRWKHHATSYSTSSPVLFGDPLTLESEFIALDLEYEQGEIIWLVGICIVRPGGREYVALWADSLEQENCNIKRLTEIIADNPGLRVVTWNGIGADMPQLRNAVERLNPGPALDMVESRHFDLFHYVKRSVRFPIPQLGLGEVASYFAIPQVSCISDGEMALLLYQEYRRSTDEARRAALKENLLDYNRDDLDALVGVTERIVDLSNVASPPTI